jgi:hypothetical protein
MTAAVLLLPIAWLPLLASRMIFVGVGAGLCAFAITRDRWRWPVLVSGSFLVAVQAAQWSPWLVAALSLPWVGAVLSAKPHVALALLSSASRRVWIAAVLSGALVLAISLILWPGWPATWSMMARAYSSFSSSLLVRPLGWLLLLALFKWRNPRARLLVALAAMPHTVAAYEELPLFLIPATQRQTILLAVGSHLANLVQIRSAAGTYDAELVHSAYLAMMYLPCLWMVFQSDRMAGDGGAAHTPESHSHWSSDYSAFLAKFVRARHGRASRK